MIKVSFIFCFQQPFNYAMSCHLPCCLSLVLFPVFRMILQPIRRGGRTKLNIPQNYFSYIFIQNLLYSHHVHVLLFVSSIFRFATCITSYYCQPIHFTNLNITFVLKNIFSVKESFGNEEWYSTGRLCFIYTFSIDSERLGCRVQHIVIAPAGLAI